MIMICDTQKIIAVTGLFSRNCRITKLIFLLPGEDCTFEKMDQVREQQEHLARLHFELDSHQEMRGYVITPGSPRELKNGEGVVQ